MNPDHKPSDIKPQRHGVRAVLISGVGHFAMMEDPSTFDRLLGETVQEFTAARASGTIVTDA